LDYIKSEVAKGNKSAVRWTYASPFGCGCKYQKVILLDGWEDNPEYGDLILSGLANDIGHHGDFYLEIFEKIRNKS
jgi:hypothetical protein